MHFTTATKNTCQDPGLVGSCYKENENTVQNKTELTDSMILLTKGENYLLNVEHTELVIS